MSSKCSLNQQAIDRISEEDKLLIFGYVHKIEKELSNKYGQQIQMYS